MMSSPASTDLTIVPLTPDWLDDLATLFDQGDDPKWCWCASFRVRNQSFSRATVAANRSILTRPRGSASV